ncbi:hypothetical protein N7452_008150 [Penicillium brevicompactum]|uniref:3'-5' exonuclease domain-containing protein n=1 Tax=Penicillium brevicompactum TaxID=5074 RepID=A0A9W9Q6G3_PENBR|nr:hypothetical protein N7452_008150 [Penicillium brevicompactum]
MWDDDDEPAPTPVNRNCLPGNRPQPIRRGQPPIPVNRTRSAQAAPSVKAASSIGSTQSPRSGTDAHRNVGAMLRSRMKTKMLAEEVIEIETALQNMPSFAVHLETYIQLKYKHLDDIISEFAAIVQSCEGESQALTSLFNKQIDDIISQMTNLVLEANSITQAYVSEFDDLANSLRQRWGAVVAINNQRVSEANDVTKELEAELEALSCSILERLTAEVSLITRQVSEAGNITRIYIGQVKALSSSIIGLDHLVSSVSESRKENARIDHEFCTIVFEPIQHWRRELRAAAVSSHIWRRQILASERTLLAPRVEISGLYIRSLQETIYNEYLKPRKIGRYLIDRIIAPVEQTRVSYAVMRQKFLRAFDGFAHIMYLCGELSQTEELTTDARLRFGRFQKTFAVADDLMRTKSHHYRALWRDRQVAALGFSRMQTWTLNDLAKNTSNNFSKTISSIFQGSYHILEADDEVIRSQLRKTYPALDPRHVPPAYDPLLNIYWRQLDVVSPMEFADVLSWRLHGEVHYLRRSLNGDCGTLWTWLPRNTSVTVSRALRVWSSQYATYRNEFRADYLEFKYVNWLRLVKERSLRSNHSSGYLAGKFEVPEPLSQSSDRFNEWVGRMARELQDGYLANSVRKLTPTQWDNLQDEYSSRQVDQSVPTDLGSSLVRPKRRKGTIRFSRKTASLAHPRKSKWRPLSLNSRKAPIFSTQATPWILPLTEAQVTQDRGYSTYANSRGVVSEHTGDVSRKSIPGTQSLEDEITPVTSTETQRSAESAPITEQAEDEIFANNSTTDPAAPIYWSHSSQQSPAGNKIIVHYCRTLRSTEEIVQLFLTSKVIGFDMEWKSSASSWDSKQNNVSLIQIANEERIALFQVALFKPGRTLSDLVSPSLKQLIESPDITKVGVSIKADCTRLRKYLSIDAKATFELSHLFKLVKFGRDNPKLVNKRGVNLSDQVREHFGLPLDKSEDVRCGDWARTLNYQQIQYAATDPYACVRLFHTMEAKRLAMNPMPPRPAFAELGQPIVLPLAEAITSTEQETLA